MGPAGAHALGIRLQEAQEQSCPACAAQVTQILDRCFECIDGGGDEQRSARERLLRLGQEFADEAARRVLHGTLGLNRMQPSARDT